MNSSQWKKALAILETLFDGDQFWERTSWRRRWRSTEFYCRFHYNHKTFEHPDVHDLYIRYEVVKQGLFHDYFIKYDEAISYLLSLDWEGSGIDKGLSYFVDLDMDDQCFNLARADFANGLRYLKQHHPRSKIIKKVYKRMEDWDVPWNPEQARSCVKILNNRCIFDKACPSIKQQWWRNMYDLVVDSYNMGLLDYKLTAKLRSWCEVQDYRYGFFDFYYRHPTWSFEECWKSLRDIFCDYNIPAKIRRNYFDMLNWMETRENERC